MITVSEMFYKATGDPTKNGVEAAYINLTLIILGLTTFILSASPY